MNVIDTSIQDVKIIQPDKFKDCRGFFSETYNKKDLSSEGIDFDFIQDSHSFSHEKGTVRGLHYQIPPYTQNKLIRVIKGSIFDVVVDIRKSSPTFGMHITEIISAKNWNQILVPIGFAHGFCTLEEDTEVIYKVTNYYSPECSKGLLWSDKELSIDWPVCENEATLSKSDKELPTLSTNKFFFK